MSIERMCYLAQVSRAGFYRSLQADQPSEEEMAVRTAIQGVAIAHRRRYGYRRITALLNRQLRTEGAGSFARRDLLQSTRLLGQVEVVRIARTAEQRFDRAI